jgi:hypothetical protein
MMAKPQLSALKNKPAGVQFQEEFLKSYLRKVDNIAEKWSYPITPEDNYTWSDELPPVLNMSESCLTLDVMVPKSLYDKMGSKDFYPARP